MPTFDELKDLVQRDPEGFEQLREKRFLRNSRPD
ncbi:DUF3135 domain-containing protein [Marinobacter alexandrii]